MRVSAHVCFAALFASAIAHGQCTLSGDVLHGGSPVAGADIFEQTTQSPVHLGQTDLQGHFSVTASPVSPRDIRNVLIVRMAGFDQLVLGLPGGVNRCPVLSPSTLSVSSAPAAAGVSTTGTNLFVAPYLLQGSTASQADVNEFNSNLILAIYSKVRLFRSQLEEHTSGPLPEMGVVPLTTHITLTDPEAVRAAGTEVNALGVITGFAETDGTTTKTLRMSSELRVIPRYPAYNEYHIEIGDSLPGTKLNALAVSERLKDLWGKRATIALLVRALSAASGANDKPQLKIVRSWIIALRSKLGPGPEDIHMASELEGLKTDVDREIAK